MGLVIGTLRAYDVKSVCRRLVVPALAALFCACAVSLPDPTSEPSLKGTMQSHFLIGGAIEPWQLDVPADVVTRFRGRVYAWDVVNEVASDNTGEIYRETSPWHVALGPDYIEYAFRAARAADPNGLLFINDYNTEQPAKRARVLTIVQDLIAKGVPLDGVGHQLHMQYDDSAADVDGALTAVEALGLINHVTELDISIYSDPGSCFSSKTGCQADYGASVPPAALSTQARLYRQLFSVFKAHKSVRSVTLWGISDGHTWLNTFPVTRTNLPLLFDTARDPKRSFWAVVDPASVVP